jgi:hypothetical protein
MDVRASVRSMMPRTFTMQLSNLPPYSVVNASHSYPYGSVFVQTSGDPNVTGVTVSITIWATRKYLDGVDVRSPCARDPVHSPRSSDLAPYLPHITPPSLGIT